MRDTTDVMEKYRKGALGALPDPELINSLLSIKGDEIYHPVQNHWCRLIPYMEDG